MISVLVPQSARPFDPLGLLFFLGWLALWVLLVSLLYFIHQDGRSKSTRRSFSRKTLARIKGAERPRVPPELAVAPPRRMSWRGGALDESPEKDKIVALLVDGFVAQGLILRRLDTHSTTGVDWTTEYGFTDQANRLWLASVDEFAGETKGPSFTGLEEGTVVHVVFDPEDPRRHVVFETLRLDAQP